MDNTQLVTSSAHSPSVDVPQQPQEALGASDNAVETAAYSMEEINPEKINADDDFKLGLSLEQQIHASAAIVSDTVGSPNPAETPDTPVTKVEIADDDKKRQRRQMVIAELLETERGYLNDLNNLVRNVFDPLNNAYLAGVARVKTKETVNAASIAQNTTFGNEDTDGWITFDQKQAVIRNGSHLLRAQKLFAKLLEDAAAVDRPCLDIHNEHEDAERPVVTGLIAGDYSVISIARCFITMAPKIEAVYLPFCSLHDTALETLVVLRKAHPSQFQSFIEECRSKMHSKLEIQDFLIKPVQRICKYPLLIAEMLKSTPIGSLDYFELVEAQEKLKSIVRKINEQKKWAENERRKELLLGRLQAGYATAFQDVGQALGITVSSDAKLLSSVQGLQARLGRLLRGCGLLAYHHDDHELPFVTSVPRTAVREFDYLGIFLFQDVIFVVFAKKANAYQLMDVIPVKDIVNLQEMHNDACGLHESNVMRLKYSWRLTWQQSSYFRSIDFGVRSDKELRSWLDELSHILPTQKIAYNSSEENSPSSPSQSSTQCNYELAKKTASNSSDIVSIMNEDYMSEQSLTNQASTDLRFSDVFTVESLVLGKVGASAGHYGAGALKLASKSLANQSGSSSTGLKTLFFGTRNKSPEKEPAVSERLSPVKKTKPMFGATGNGNNSFASSKENLNAGVQRGTSLAREKSIDISDLLGNSPTTIPAVLPQADKLASMPDLTNVDGSRGGNKSQDLLHEESADSDEIRGKKSSFRAKILSFGLGSSKKDKPAKASSADGVAEEGVHRVNSTTTSLLRASSLRSAQNVSHAANGEGEIRRSLLGSLRRSASQKSTKYPPSVKQSQPSQTSLPQVEQVQKESDQRLEDTNKDTPVTEVIQTLAPVSQANEVDAARDMNEKLLYVDILDENSRTPRPSAAEISNPRGSDTIESTKLTSETNEHQNEPSQANLAGQSADAAGTGSNATSRSTSRPQSARVPHPPSQKPEERSLTGSRLRRRRTSNSRVQSMYSSPEIKLDEHLSAMENLDPQSALKSEMPTAGNKDRSYSVGTDRPISDLAILSETIRRSHENSLQAISGGNDVTLIGQQASNVPELNVILSSEAVPNKGAMIRSHIKRLSRAGKDDAEQIEAFRKSLALEQQQVDERRVGQMLS